jgi:hypothetical protein
MGWVPIRAIVCLLLAGILAIIITLLMTWMYPKDLEILKLETLFTQTLQYASMIKIGVCFSYLENVIQHLPKTMPSWSLPMISAHRQQQIWLNSAPIIQILLLGFKLYLIRLYILLMYLPLIILTLSTAFIDGLTQRTIRRHTVARESALLYHQGKMLTTFSILFSMVVYLSLPLPIETLNWIGTITVLITACLLQITVKRFKKYL